MTNSHSTSLFKIKYQHGVEVIVSAANSLLAEKKAISNMPGIIISVRFLRRNTAIRQGTYNVH